MTESRKEIDLPREMKVFLEQEFFSTGKFPTSAQIQDQFNLTRNELLDMLPTIHQYQEVACLTDNVTLLSPEQYNLANLLINTDDRRSLRQKLQQCNVTMDTYNRWKRQPQFVNFLRTQISKRFKDTDVAADASLIKLVEDGDLKAIQYFNEVTGRYQTATQINLVQVLGIVMEVLVSHVTPEILKKVAAGLDERLNGVVDTTEVVPERLVLELQNGA